MRSPARVRAFCAGLLASAALTATSGMARGATLSLVLDQPSYQPGDTVTIRLIGDSQGAVDWTLFAVVVIDLAALIDATAVTFAPMGDAVAWGKGGIQGCNHPNYPFPNRCVLMNMVYPVAGVKSGIDAALEPFTYAVLTGTAGAPGTYSLDFLTTPTSQRIDFFGLTSAPSATLVIMNPEPGTAALLALGLGGIAAARRRARP